jgi:phospholipase C
VLALCAEFDMRGPTVAVTLIGLVAAGGFLLGLNGCNGGSSGAVGSSNKIQHVVVIFQENRTPDNLFQDPVLIGRNADIAQSGMNSKHQTITLSQIDLGTVGSNPQNYDLSHAHGAFVQMCDLNASTGVCAMDGADLIGVTCATGAANCPPANPQFMFVNPADVQPYFQMAEQYTFADRMFQTNEGPSFPAHQFIISGTSAPSRGSNLFVAENPEGVKGATNNTGCTAPSAEYVEQINPAGVESPIYPCLEHRTVTDLLDAANITWRYYAPSAGSIWTAPNAIQHMCGPNATPPNATACVGSDWTGTAPKVVLNQTQSNAQILTDIAAGQLAQVSWVIPDGLDSDHALSNDGCGPSWVSSILNAIGHSQYWSNTAIIITWDDWGGWYDHVPPKVVNDGVSWGSGYVYGFRVPLIVVSPYARPAYISHVTHDFGSILKFIEKNFGLPSLGYADAAADDLSDAFNYDQNAIAFQTITPPANNAQCMSDPSPATDPDDD